MKLPRRDGVLAPLLLGLVALLALLLTLAAWHVATRQTEERARIRFELQAAGLAQAIRGRMHDYAQVLRGTQGLFAASQEVSREEWAHYVRSLALDEAYPGVLALGFARVPAGGREHVRVRVTYIEPENEINRRALGFDLASEPDRRDAMERARESGRPALTGPLVLLQDRDTAPQPGVLLFLPVYTRSTAAKPGAVFGYTYGAFRVSDLLRGTMGREPDIALRLFDAADSTSPRLLYENTGSPWPRAPLFQHEERLEVGGRTWLLQAGSTPTWEAGLDTVRPRLAIGAGVLIGLLALGITAALLGMRGAALRLANRMTQRLRESEERLGLALEASGLALFDWNVSTGEVLLSAKWGDIVGGPRRPLRTSISELRDLVHPDDVPGMEKLVRAVLVGRIEHYNLDHRVRTQAGGWRWIASRAKVVERGADGRASRITGTNADITERKELEQLKSGLISVVSHELRTPLTSIVASLALLREGSAGELPGEARAFVDMAAENSDRLAALVNDLLDMERAESGQLDLRPRALDAAELLARVAALNAPYCERHGVRLVTQAAPGLTLLADEDRTIQVLTNLVANAAKFSPRDGEVHLNAEKQTQGIRLSVEDHGPGIPDEFRPRIFQKFAQADASDARRRGGTGLGLAISKALVERMGGRIWFESAPGRGTRFHVELPRVS